MIAAVLLGLLGSVATVGLLIVGLGLIVIITSALLTLRVRLIYRYKYRRAGR